MNIDVPTINFNNCHNVVNEIIIEEQICTQHKTLHLNSAEISAIEHEIIFTKKQNNNEKSISSNYNSELNRINAKHFKNRDNFLIFTKTKEFKEILDNVINDINILTELSVPYITDKNKFKTDMSIMITKLKDIVIYDKHEICDKYKIDDLIDFFDSGRNKIKDIIHFFNLITAYNIYIDKEEQLDIECYLKEIPDDSIKSLFLRCSLKQKLDNLCCCLNKVFKKSCLIKEIITNIASSIAKEVIQNEIKTGYIRLVKGRNYKLRIKELIRTIANTYGIDYICKRTLISHIAIKNKFKNKVAIAASTYNILINLTDTMFNKLINIVKNHSSEELFTKGVSEKEIPQSLISDITSFFVKPLNSMLLSKNSETIDIGDILAINDNGFMKITKDSLAKLRFLIVQKLLGKKLQWVVSEVYTQHNSADFEQVIVAIGNSYFGIMNKNNLYTKNNQINITFDNNTAVQLKHIKPELIEKNNLQKTSYRPLIIDALKNTENATEILNFFNNNEIKNILRDDLEFLSHLAEIISKKAEKSSVLKENLVELICNEIIAENKNILVFYSNYNIFIQTTLLEPILHKLIDQQIDITDILAQLEISQIANLSQQDSLKNICDRVLTLIDNTDESKKKIADNFVKIHHKLMKYGHSHVIPLIISTNLINSALGLITKDHENELLICTRYKNLESIKVIIQENSKRPMQNKLDINQYSGNDTAVMISTKNKDLAILTEILKDNNVDVNLRKQYECTALMVATLDNNIEIVKILLEKNANVDLHASDNDTALMYAVRGNHIEIVKMLLEKNANVNLQSGIYYYTALVTAVINNYKTCVEILLNHHQTDINLLCGGYKTALMAAIDNTPFYYGYDRDVDSNINYVINIGNDDTTYVKMLLTHQADINLQNQYGDTALILAITHDKIACVEMLLNYQADINLQNTRGTTALMFAIKNDKIACVEILLNHQADTNLEDDSGNTALILAAQNERIACIEMLLNHRVDINLQNRHGSTALMYAAEKAKIACLEILLNHQADMNLQDTNGYTALMYATKNNSAECIKMLLEKNADVDLQGGVYSYTALMIAAGCDSITCAKILLNHYQTDINQQNKHGLTALMVAVISNNDIDIEDIEDIEDMDIDIDSDGDINRDYFGKDSDYLDSDRDYFGRNSDYFDRDRDSFDSDSDIDDIEPVKRNNNYVTCVAVLLNHQADINLQNNDGVTALMLAVQQGKTTFVKMLLNHQADINLQDKNGYTALMFAAKNGYAECIKILLKHKADVKITNKYGCTALDIAKAKKNKECIAYLENRSCKRTYKESKQDLDKTKIKKIKL